MVPVNDLDCEATLLLQHLIMRLWLAIDQIGNVTTGLCPLVTSEAGCYDYASVHIIIMYKLNLGAS